MNKIVKNNSPIFIGGQMKSGTTLVRALLSQHPNIFGGLETHWFDLPSKVDINDSINFFRDIGVNKIRGISYPYGGVHSVSQSVFDACHMFDDGITMQRGINFFDSSMNKLALKRVDANEAPGGKLNSEEYK